jgi:putative FmdB family regulatory protein
MPIYEYQCTKCRHVCEVLQKAKEKPLEKCPECGEPVVKLISSPAIQFKGTGWYVTDYAKKDSSPAGHKAHKETPPKTEAKTEAKSGSGETAGAAPGKSSS